MTPQEAKVLLKIEDGDEFIDRWEQEMFGIKRYFLTSTPIPKVFYAKLARLRKFEEAYFTLIGVDVPSLNDAISIELVNFSPEVSEAFHQLHVWRTSIKQRIHSTHNVEEIVQLIEAWMRVEKAYITQWVNPRSTEIPAEMVISKEPDPMEILTLINNWKSAEGLTTFHQLHMNFSFLPERLRFEVKRLTLLAEHYGERFI